MKKRIIATVVCFLLTIFATIVVNAQELNQPTTITENGGVVFYGAKFKDVSAMAEENALKSDRRPLVWVILSCNDQECVKVYWFNSIVDENLQNLINNLEDDVDFYQVSQVIVNDELDAVKKAFKKDGISAVKHTLQPIPTIATTDVHNKNFPYFWNISSKNDQAFILNVGIGTNKL